MINIINFQNQTFKNLKEKLNLFLKILNKNKLKLNNESQNNLQIKLDEVNEDIELLSDKIDNILLELKDCYCDMDESTINNLQETKNINDTINELKPFLILYQLKKNGVIN